MHQTEQFFFLSYVDDCVYWYTSEASGKWFVDTLGKIFHVKLLGYTHWITSIRIYQMKDHSISVDQSIYATSIVTKYLDTSTVKTSKTFYKTTFKYDMIFTKADAYTSNDQVAKLTRELNIHYRYCIGSLIYLLSKRMYLSFEVHKLAKFSSIPGKLHLERLVYILRCIMYNKTLVLKYYADINDTPVYDPLI